MDHQFAQSSLEETPAWAVSVVCLVLIVLSMLIEAALELLTKFLQRRKKNSLKQAMGKIKTELMIMGFISLLLTIGEDLIVKICITEATANSFLPCEEPPHSKKPSVSDAEQVAQKNAMLPIEHEDLSHCEAKGMISMISSEGLKQLHIFIFVLTVFHVLYCVLTMALGIAKMRKWKSWEEETRTLDYEIAYDPRRFQLTRQTPFGKRHLKFWSDQPLLLWPVCFVRQFSDSLTKADYFTLRNGFIVEHFAEGSNFDFQKFLVRAFDEDFVQVVGIRILQLLLATFYSATGKLKKMVLAVGTKLQNVVTKMCLESRNKTKVVHGIMLVKPNDNLFWFSKPQWLLHVIHFILFQMGSGMKETIFTERIAKGLKHWHSLARQNLHKNRSLTKKEQLREHIENGLTKWYSLAHHSLSRNKSTSTAHSSEPRETHTREGSISDVQELHSEENEQLPSLPIKNAPTEITDEVIQHQTLSGRTNDGEVSFRTSSEQYQPSVLSISNSSTTEIIDEVYKKIITRGKAHSDIIFGMSSEHEQPLPMSTANSATTKITEGLIQHQSIRKGTYDGEISFGTSFKDLDCNKDIESTTSSTDKITSCTEIIEEMMQHPTVTEGTHDGEISFRTLGKQEQPPVLSIRNSSTTEIIEEVDNKIITKGTTHSGIIFGTPAEHEHPLPMSTANSATTKITEGLIKHENITKGTYDGEISFGTSWKI
ncbi:Mlo-like protein [Thalictrum thalictroides]|uniref:Mlo-like protein n=1 Tax=Thalictrum thalictroides TaxID=46969 RepID=A0A7J6WX78_THATH|nr:Mlo-like protein [Thalictrum thalictroides]